MIPKPKREPFPINVRPDVMPPRFYKMRSGETLDLGFIWLDSAYKHYKEENITFDNYDKSIIDINGLTVTAKRVGYTYANANTPYGLSAEILIYVYPGDFDFSEDGKYPVSVLPVKEEYKTNLKENERKQIRLIVQYSNGTWTETRGAQHGVKYYGYDENIISVDENGVIFAKAAGKTKVTAALGSFEVVYKVMVNKI